MHSRIASFTRRLHTRPILAGLSSAVRTNPTSSASQPIFTRATSFRTNPVFSARSFSTATHANATHSVNTSVDTVQRLAKMVEFDHNGDNDANETLLRHVMDMFHKKEKVPRDFIVSLLDHAIAVQMELPNVLSVNRSTLQSSVGQTDSPVTFTSNLTVVGDVHGQYEDFATIFEESTLGGYPSNSNQFIFNGDLVDRGSMALEIVTTLLLAKLLAPNSIHILRGNHETRAMSEHYGFAVEVKRKYDHVLLDKFQSFFDTLPIAALVENSAFVVHGGIGPNCVNLTVKEINQLDRFNEPDHGSVISEFLWSDPKDKISGFRLNPGRGGGTVMFGANVTEAFLAHNGLQVLIRSHEVAMEGYEVLHNGLCLTVFSAPNYCGNTGNLGAVVRFDDPHTMKASLLQFYPAVVLKQLKAEASQKDSGGQHPTQ